MSFLKKLKKLDPIGSKVMSKTAKLAPKGSLSGALSKKVSSSGKAKTVAPRTAAINKMNNLSKISAKVR
jgi:hypothetical protein